jgi:hypothetical protein
MVRHVFLRTVPRNLRNNLFSQSASTPLVLTTEIAFHQSSQAIFWPEPPIALKFTPKFCPVLKPRSIHHRTKSPFRSLLSPIWSGPHTNARDFDALNHHWISLLNWQLERCPSELRFGGEYWKRLGRVVFAFSPFTQKSLTISSEFLCDVQISQMENERWSSCLDLRSRHSRNWLPSNHQPIMDPVFLTLHPLSFQIDWRASSDPI